MIKYTLLTGDLHGNPTRIEDWAIRMHQVCGQLDEFAVIILGDAGFNYYLNERDSRTKDRIEQLWGLTVYCVRGNHEQRPHLIGNMMMVYDDNTHNYVNMEQEWPHIKYFKDGCNYIINEYRTLVIGGAYSVDKDYRLLRHWQWFPQEQLSEEEMNKIATMYQGQHFDLVLTHTCPFSWQPIDLFLQKVDQNTVDSSMEWWMDKFKDMISWDAWAFGHFHGDRIIHFDKRVRMFYEDMEDLDQFMRHARE